jgi:hypothetical protein
LASDAARPQVGIEVTMADSSNEAPRSPVREIPIDWEALENAFENNAPEVHSYLHLVTGDVLRVVDGVADPQMHARIASDPRYLRVEPVSSREQYRWMERYIPMVEDQKLRARLEVSIDGKGAFRRFKDVLMAHGTERERWFTYRSERLRTFMEAWLGAHSIKALPRVEWVGPKPPAEQAPAAEEGAGGTGAAAGPPDSYDVRRGRGVDALRARLHDLADALGPRDLDSAVAFAEFLRARRTARSFAHHHGHHARRDEREDRPESEEPSAAAGAEAAAGSEVATDAQQAPERGRGTDASGQGDT